MKAIEKKRAFVSYRESELEYAVRASDAAAVLGWKCFVAEHSLGPGVEWRQEIRNELWSADLFVAILTPAWGKSNWTIFELEVYQQCCHQQSKPITIVPLEFEPVTDADLMAPPFSARQRVKRAGTLTKEALCWALVCASNPGKCGPRGEWEAKGRELIGHPVAPTKPVASNASLSAAARIELADILCLKYPTLLGLRQVAQFVFGVVPPGLPVTSRAASYQIVKLADTSGRIDRLRTVIGVN